MLFYMLKRKMTPSQKAAGQDTNFNERPMADISQKRGGSSTP